MDSKNIYIATSHMKSMINWEEHLGNEWSFVGEGIDFNSDKVNKFIASYFSEDELYIVMNRHLAFEVSRISAGSKVKEYLKEQSVTLCNGSFNKMIEFDFIGVAKCGAIKN